MFFDYFTPGGLMYSKQYISKTDNKIVPILQTFPSGVSIFQQDLAPCYTFKLTTNFFIPEDNGFCIGLLSENKSGGAELSSSNLDSAEDIKLIEGHCEKSEDSTDDPDNILVNPELYVTKELVISDQGMYQKRQKCDEINHGNQDSELEFEKNYGHEMF
ncbi:hypothetical protein TNCV_400761 [Trichonephila clavipes]|nr:hypothetical protein TNCV_400761 [Trichonephila clavipes]